MDGNGRQIDWQTSRLQFNQMITINISAFIFGFSGVVKAQQATKDQKNFPLMTKKQNVFPPSLSRAVSFIVNEAQNMNHTVGWTALLSPSQRGFTRRLLQYYQHELQQIPLWKVHQWTHLTQSHKQNHHIFTANNKKNISKWMFFFKKIQFKRMTIASSPVHFPNIR